LKNRSDIAADDAERTCVRVLLVFPVLLVLRVLLGRGRLLRELPAQPSELRRVAIPEHPGAGCSPPRVVPL